MQIQMMPGGMPVPPPAVALIPAAPVVAPSTKPVFLGLIEGKKYYLDVDPRSSNYNQVIWAVPDIRDAVRAEPGKIIVAADYSQIEIRIMAFISKDPWLIAAINSRKDMHCYMSNDVFGRRHAFTYDDIWAATQADDAKQHPRHKELTRHRNRIKRTSFGIPYGVSPLGLSLMIDSTEEEAAQLMADYFAKAHVLESWLHDQAEFAIRNGFTTSLLGRKRFYTMPHPSDPQAANILKQIARWSGNHPIQASSADMLKLAMVKLYTELRDGDLTKPAKWGAQILFVVHDEIVTQCDEEYAEEMKALVEYCMDWAYEQLIGADKVYHKTKAVAADVWSKA